MQSPADLVPRYGGEEFLVILPHTKAGDAVQVAEEIRCAVKALEIAQAGLSSDTAKLHWFPCYSNRQGG